MSQPVIQTSFNSGEWAPALNARVDLTKYHSGAALLRNFFVDYRGGATARGGSKYIIQAFISGGAIRLIPFQASFTVSYVLEFGEAYIRFINNGAPVLEAPIAITAATQANPCAISVVNAWSVGDWIFIQNVGGMTQLNGNYYRVGSVSGVAATLEDLNGVPIDSTAFTTYTAGGTASRIYKIASPYPASQLFQLKFAQNVNTLILDHPNFPPYILTLNSAANWTLAQITFGSTVPAPTGQAVATTLAGGTVNYAYVITAVDTNGQESPTSAYAVLANKTDLRSVAGTNTVSWTAVTGASSYNIYKAEPSYAGAVPAGSAFGFVGNVTGLSLIDSNISPDFSQGPPIVENPFFGTGVATVTITNPGTYTSVPAITFTGGGGSGAVASATLTTASINIVSGGTSYAIGDTLNLGNGIIIQVTSVSGFGTVSGFSIVSSGLISSGPAPASGGVLSTSGSGNAGSYSYTWQLASIGITNPGTGYGPAPTVVISGGGGGAATAVLGAPSAGNPTVPGFFQQRLVLAGPVTNPQQFNMSETGSYFNYNIHNPIQADDAIQGQLVSGQLNTIQALVTQPQGLIILSDKQAWLLNGGSPGSAVTPSALVANSQAYNGCSSFPPPIVANDHILYVQSKNSIVRDLAFNFYTQVYTGTDISVLSSHLFYGFQIREWAWAEEPFKVVWAVRNDGVLLSLTFLKEQELIAWAHSDTQGSYKSIATVVETVAIGPVDAVYTVVQRAINGNVVQYIERMTELAYPAGVTDAWCVDAGLQYNGASVLTFSGAQHLAGATVTGLATDNLGRVTIITPFVMPVSGNFGVTQLPAPPAPATGYTRVTVGLSYLPQLQTLQLDIGEPTVQGKMKKISGVTVRVNQTLGLSIGKTFGTLVPMKDLVRGNVGSATNTVTTNLVTGDAMTIIDPSWDVPGQYCIAQPFPLPASILGVIPKIDIGDTKK